MPSCCFNLDGHSCRRRQYKKRAIRWIALCVPALVMTRPSRAWFWQRPGQLFPQLCRASRRQRIGCRIQHSSSHGLLARCPSKASGLPPLRMFGHEMRLPPCIPRICQARFHRGCLPVRHNHRQTRCGLPPTIRRGGGRHGNRRRPARHPCCKQKAA